MTQDVASYLYRKLVPSHALNSVACFFMFDLSCLSGYSYITFFIII